MKYQSLIAITLLTSILCPKTSLGMQKTYAQVTQSSLPAAPVTTPKKQPTDRAIALGAAYRAANNLNQHEITPEIKKAIETLQHAILVSKLLTEKIQNSLPKNNLPTPEDDVVLVTELDAAVTTMDSTTSAPQQESASWFSWMFGSSAPTDPQQK